jgi:membrane-associated protease RseP (regulator of RpoE activity)
LDGYTIVLIILLAWFVILFLGQKLKFWEKIHAAPYGPFLMFKTVRGRNFIERLARRARFWTLYGRVSIGITIGSMVTLMLLMIWEAFLVLGIPASAAPAPETLIGIPGINPLIPLWYGILGLIVAVVAHEFAHGIVSRVGKIKVQSLGVLLLVVPMGAFVEPDEDEIKAADMSIRTRLYAAGPATNMIIALICLLAIVLVVAPSAQTVHDGAVVTGIASDSPASHFSLSTWSEVINVDGAAITDPSQLRNITFNSPGEEVNVTLIYNGQESTMQLPAGVVVLSVTGSLPAFNVGITPGMIIAELNGTPICNISGFQKTVETAPHDIPINITVLKYGYDATRGKNWFIPDNNITKITLTTKWRYFFTYNPSENKEEYRNISYMGITTSYAGETSSLFGARFSQPGIVIDAYATPFRGGNLFRDSISLIALPFLGYTPVEGPIASLYEPTGIFASLPADVFWVTLNSLYWIFWINLMVGLTNALPAVPLDGGYVFRDLLKGLVLRTRKPSNGLDKVVEKPMTDEELDKMIRVVSLVISLFVLFLFVWQIIVPRL